MEIVSDKQTKPFLGGFRVMPDDLEYHHACVQTEKIRRHLTDGEALPGTY